MIDTTLIILKPDAVKRKLVGEIITRIEKKNLSIARMNMRTLDKEILDQHYEEHKEKGFYPELVDFMSCCGYGSSRSGCSACNEKSYGFNRSSNCRSRHYSW